MGPGTDKLFLEVAGHPVVAHTWRRFDRHPLVDHVCVVVRSGMERDFAELGRQLDLRKPHTLVPGGAERQDSVWNGLAAVPPDTRWVAIQDGARPCTTDETITRCLRAAN
ncbi:MAG: 2-C-methyl-D-erythritol 4-phosphate cytidylyltransferase, partial [Verrucomicrobiota bacterium]